MISQWSNVVQIKMANTIFRCRRSQICTNELKGMQLGFGEQTLGECLHDPRCDHGKIIAERKNIAPDDTDNVLSGSAFQALVRYSATKVFESGSSSAIS